MGDFKKACNPVFVRSDKFDTVCIGASPICLLEALNAARAGRSALVVEASDSMGGAWGGVEVFGLKRVEIAPHIILHNRQCYDYFEKHLGVQMKRMLPPPHYVVCTSLGSFFIPYALAPFVAYFTAPLHYVRNPEFRANFALVKEEYFGRLGNATSQLFSWLFGKHKPWVEYPEGGALELLDRIEELLRKYAVEIRLNTEVTGISKLESGILEIETSGGYLHAANVFMTRHQKVERFRTNGRQLNVEYRPFVYNYVHFLVRTTQPSRAAFMLVKKDPAINLVSDLTPYTQGLPQGTRLLCARLHQWNKTPSRAEGFSLFRHMQSSGLIPEQSEVMDVAFGTYQQGRLMPADIAAIENAFGSTVRIFRSTNFANSIGAETSRWLTWQTAVA